MYAHRVTGRVTPTFMVPGEVSDSTQYTMPDGRQVTALNDGPSYEDLVRRMQFARGGSYGGGGGYASRGGGGGSPMDAYQDAYNGARGANEQRYNDILAEYDKMLGGGGKKAPERRGNSVPGAVRGSNNMAAWRDSGTALGPLEYRMLRAQLERTAAQRGGSYGGIDASGVFPRMYGNGEFLGTPPAGQQPVGGSYGQRPQVQQPTYPTYTPPTRKNVNY